jgi:hypothetical protein
MKGLDLFALATQLTGASTTLLTSNQTAGSNSTLAYSPPYYPSPWMTGKGDWAEAYQTAKDFVSQLTLLEKVNITTGTSPLHVAVSTTTPSLREWLSCTNYVTKYTNYE